jgi:hypothetical protein
MSLSRSKQAPPTSSVGLACNFRALFGRHSHSRGVAAPGHLFEIFAPRLFDRSSPSAIFWRVWAVVINAINRVLGRRTTPHVRQEGVIRVAPSVAHMNAAASIAVIVDMARAGASGLHSLPDFVFGGRLPLRALSVLFIWATSAVFSFQAAAAFGAASPQVSGSCCSASTALTRALPQYASGNFADELNRNQTTKALPGQIEESHRMILTRGAYVSQ